MDKPKSKVDLRAAGKKRLEEFRQKKQSKGSRAKSPDKSKHFSEEASSVEAVPHPDQNPDSESSAIVSSRLSEGSESFNKEGTETGKVEEPTAEEGMNLATGGFSIGEVSSRGEEVGPDGLVDIVLHERERSEYTEGQGKLPVETDVAVPSNMSSLTKDADSPVIQGEVFGSLPAGDLLLESKNTSRSSTADLGVVIESSPIYYSELKEDSHEKAAGEDTDVKLVTSKSDGVHLSEQVYYRSSEEGVPGGGDIGANIVTGETCHVGEILHSRRLTDQEMGYSDIDQQQNKDGILQPTTHVDMEGPTVMLLTGDPQPCPTGFLHDLEDERNKVMALEKASVSGLDQLPSFEGKGMNLEYLRSEMERVLLENERLFSELDACRESLMQAKEENGRLIDKLNFHHLQAEQTAVDNSHLQTNFNDVVNENCMLKTDLEACVRKLQETQENESLSSAELSTNKGLAQENAKLIAELEQLKQMLYGLEQEKLEKAFAFEEFRTQLQAETEGKIFLSHELDNAQRKLQELMEERDALTGRIEAAVTDIENTRKERAVAVNELQASQLELNELTESGTQSALELASLQQKLQQLEADKVSALSKMKEVHRNLFVTEAVSVKVVEQVEESQHNELCLTVELERFAKVAKEREEEFLTKLEDLRYQLQFTNDEKYGLLMQLDEQARIKMETQQNYQQVVSELTEMRVLINEVQKERECLAGDLDRYKLEASCTFMEKEEFKIEALNAKEQIEELSVQITRLKEELQQEQEDKGRLAVELDGFKALVEKLRNEREELAQDFCLTRSELEQIKSKADLQEKLEDEINHLAEDNNKLLAELNQCREDLLTIQYEQVQGKNELREVALKLQKVAEENMNLKSSLHEHEHKLAVVGGEYSRSILDAEEAKDELQSSLHEHGQNLSELRGECLLSTLEEEESKVKLQKPVNRNEGTHHESEAKSYNRQRGAQEEQVGMRLKELESHGSVSKSPMALLNHQVGNLAVENPQIMAEPSTEDRAAVSAPEASLKQVQDLIQERSQLRSQLQSTEQQLFQLQEELAQACQKLTAVQVKEQTDLQDSRLAPVSVEFTNDYHELTKASAKAIDLDRTHEYAAKLEEENHNLLQELDLLKHHITEMEQENACLKADYGSMQLQLQALEDIRTQSLAEISRLEDQVEKVSSILTEKLIDATHQLEELRQQNAGLQQRYGSVVKQVQDLEDDRAQLNAEINRLKNQLDASAEIGEALKRQLLEVQNEKAQLALDLELSNKQLEELDVSSKLEKTELLQQITEQDSAHADKVSHLKSRLNEAELTSQKLEKAVREMFPDPSSLSKASGRVPSGVSKLIRAFEAKAQHEDGILEGGPSPETEHGSRESLEKLGQESDASPVQDVSVVLQQLKEAEVEVGCLRATVSQLERDADIVKQQLKEEEEERGLLTSALRHLEVDVDVLRQQKSEQEENLAALREKNEQLIAQALKDNSQIENLHTQLQSLEKQAWEKSVALQGQLEQSQRESAEQLSLLEAERNSSMVAMLNAVERLEETIQQVSSKHMYDSAPSSVVLCLATVVNATVEKIDELRNLEVELKVVQEQRVSAVNDLLNVHGRLRKLIEQQERMNEETEKMFDRLRNVEAKEVEGDGQNAESILPPNVLSDDLDKFVAQLQKTLEERSQLEATTRQLESALLTKDQDIQDLNAKCVELSKKCIENENCQKCAALDEVRASLDSQAAQYAMEKDALCFKLDALQRAFLEQEEAVKATSNAHSQLNMHLEDMTKKLIPAVEEAIHDDIVVTDSGMQRLSHLENSILLLIEKYKESIKEIDLLQNCVVEFASKCELSGEEVTGSPLHVTLREAVRYKEKELSHLQEKLDEVNSMTSRQEEEMRDLKEKLDVMNSIRSQQEEEMRDLHEQLHKMNEDLKGANEERNKLQIDLEQAEQKLSSVREKLSIAVSKGKGLVQQRDVLKQSMAEKSNELQRCRQELQKKNAALHEAETKIKLYGEAGERVEALESELAYIRNSATALRESFLQKDSVLQKIEEILEELNLPEQFHSKEIIEKIEWLARSCVGVTSPLLRDWDQKMSERDDEDDASFQMLNPRADAFGSNQHQEIEALRRKHEELQVKYLSLAEQSDMLEQSLLERNRLIQRWEEVLDSVEMPGSMRSMEPEDRIEWLGRALSQARQDAMNTQYQIENVQRDRDLLAIELEGSERKILILEEDLSKEKHEKEVILKNLSTEKDEKEVILKSLSTEKDEKEVILKGLSTEKDEKEVILKSLKELTFKYESLTEQATQSTSEKEILGNKLVDLLEKVLEQVSSLKSKSPDNFIDAESVASRLLDTIGNTLWDQDVQMLFSSCGSEYLEGCLRNLINKFNALSDEVKVLKETDNGNILGRIAPQSMAKELQSLKEALDVKEQELTELHKKLEMAFSTVASHKSEQDRLIEQCRTLSEETEAMKIQRDALQIQLDQAEQKLSSTREKLSMAVKKGKGLVQQRDSLKQSMDEKEAELEQCRGELQARDFVIDESQHKISHLTSALERFETLESHAAKVEQTLLESNRMVQRLMTVLDAIDVTGEVQFEGPVEKIEWLANSFQELHGKMVSAELEVKKSKRAADLLATELDEVHERVDNLQDELAEAEVEISTLMKEKAAAEAAKAEATLHLEHAVAMHTEEINQALIKVDNQNSALINVRAGLEHLRKEQDHLLPLLANDFYKKLELLRGVEGTLQGILSQLAGSRESKLQSMPPIGKLSYASMNLHEEGKYLASEANPPEHADCSTEHVTHGEQMADGLLGSLAQELQGCTSSFEAMKNRFEGQSSAFSQKATVMSGLLQTVVEEVASLVQSLEAMEMQATTLKALKQEKDGEIFMLQKNITILYDTCNRVVVELENLKGQINDIDGPNSGGHATAATDSSWLASENLQTLQPKGQVDCTFTSEYCMGTAEKLLVTVKDFIHTGGERLKYNRKELNTSILKLQKEGEAKDAEHLRVCVELQNQIKKAEAVANSLAKEKDMDKGRICELEEYIETLKNDCHALEVSAKEFQERGTAMKEMEEKITSLHDALSTKNQEVEGLIEALDQAEIQMEDLSSKVDELENDIQQKQRALENLESSRGKAVAKLSSTVNRLDDLRQLSEGLLAEVENLQFQLESRDAEISRLRQEVTRCTNDILTSQENMKRKNIEIQELQAWIETMILNFGVHDRLPEEKEVSRTHVLLRMLEKRIAGIKSESESFRVDAKSKDVLLQDTRDRMEELSTKVALLEASVCDKQTQIERLQAERGSGLGAVAAGPDASEIEEVGQISKRSIPVAPHVRSMRKVPSDQLALTIDMESGQSTSDLEDDDKGHVFKSLTTSRLIPKVTRPLADRIDGIWVSGGRVLMRQPTARLGLIVYWIVLHFWMVATMV